MLETQTKYKIIGQAVKDMYNQKYSRAYRESDEKLSQDPNYQHYCRIIEQLSQSFGYPITVLDLGCGSGRYFHAFKNTKELIGVDISEDILKQAREPIFKEQITTGKLTLACKDLFEADFPKASFDFICCIGVVGEHSPFDKEVCQKMFDWLKPQGKIFFTVVDKISKPQTIRGRIVELIYPFLPDKLQAIVLSRKYFYLSRIELVDLLQKSAFRDCRIERFESLSPAWKGAHFECVLTK